MNNVQVGISLAATAIALFSLISSLISSLASRSQRRKEAVESEQVIRNSREARAELLRRAQELEQTLDVAESQISGSSGTEGAETRMWHYNKGLSDTNEETVDTLHKRLERVEQRFPEEATLEKIASINDAILATKIEQLEKSLELLDSRMITKWDVATIVFAVIGAIGVIAGAIFTVANFVLK
jgi:flagellar biosynthesis/type III secretory pathway chaperone